MRIAAALLALATAGATLSVSTIPALAEEGRQTIVQFSDLNLAAAAGRATLDTRIRGAARRVCGAGSPVQVKDSQQMRDCHKAAIANAWDQVSAAKAKTVYANR